MGELEPDVRLEEEYEAELINKPNLRLWEEPEAEPADKLVGEPKPHWGLRRDTEAGSESAAQIEGEARWEMEPSEETKAQVETPLGMVDASEPEPGLWQDTGVESATEMVDQSEPEAGLLDESKAEPGAEMMKDVEQKSGLSEDTGLGVRLTEKSGPAQGDELNPGACLEEELTVAPPHLFWKNEQNLCWLDCLLVALVHCQALREHRASLLDGASTVGQLLASYDQASLLVKAREETHQQGSLRDSSFFQCYPIEKSVVNLWTNCILFSICVKSSECLLQSFRKRKQTSTTSACPFLNNCSQSCSAN